VLYTSAAWLQTNRDTAAALSRAIVQTLRWMQEHSDMEIAQKTPPAIRGEDLELFAEAFKNSRAMFSVDGLMPADGAAAVRDVLAASNPKVKSAEIDLPDTYTNDLVNPR
jgi:NitT/TauT family transport system substrate-binding protein